MDPRKTVHQRPNLNAGTRWMVRPGHKLPEASSEDADDDGRSDSARVVEEGVAEAEHDQMLQATRV